MSSFRIELFMVLILKVTVMGVCFESNSGGRILSSHLFGEYSFLLIDNQLHLLLPDWNMCNYLPYFQWFVHRQLQSFSNILQYMSFSYYHKSSDFHLVLILYLVKVDLYVVIKAQSVSFNTCLGIKIAHNFYVSFMFVFKDWVFKEPK